MLSPYRIVDLTDSTGDFAGFVLAQLGAEVISVEPDAGTSSRHAGPFAGDEAGIERSLAHWAYNRGKQSLRASRVDLAALAATADVVIESGAVAVDLAELRRASPALVTVSISAFGSTGPKATWLASDLIVAAAAGQASLAGDSDRAPLRISEPQAFLHAGVDAAVAVLAALVERGHSGLGQHLDVSAQQSFSATTQFHMLAAAVGAPLTQRLAGGQRIGPYRLRFVYPAADGHVSILFLFGDMIGRFTQRLMDLVFEAGHCTAELRDLDYVSFFELLYAGKLDPSTLAQATEAVASFTATKTKAELFAAAQQRRLLIAPVADIADVASFPQFAATGYWDQVELPERATPVTFPGRRARFSASPLRQLAAPPQLGGQEGDLPHLLTRRPDAPAAAAAAAAASGVGARKPGARALAGLKVLDFSWVVAGPWATRFLADHGATVVRIETETTSRRGSRRWRSLPATSTPSAPAKANESTCLKPRQACNSWHPRCWTGSSTDGWPADEAMPTSGSRPTASIPPANPTRTAGSLWSAPRTPSGPTSPNCSAELTSPASPPPNVSSARTN